MRETFVVKKIYIATPTGRSIHISDFNSIRCAGNCVYVDEHLVAYSNHDNALVAWSKLTADVKSGKSFIKMLDDEQANTLIVKRGY